MSGCGPVGELTCLASLRWECSCSSDCIRAFRHCCFGHIRNFMPERPYTQYNEYIEKSYPTLGVLKELHAQGKLNAVQSLFMQPRKPPVEFYDLAADPHEVNNLAASPKHQSLVRRYAGVLDKWLKETRDLGGIPDTEAARA